MTDEQAGQADREVGDGEVFGAANPTLAEAKLAGKPSISLMKHLLHCLENAGVSYGLGAKAPSLHSEPGTFDRIDCSGFARWAVFKASDGKVIMPDGSYTQHDWCRQQGFEAADYHAAGEQANPQKLFICFITPQSSPDGIGHVWFLNGGRTIESHGGKGPDSRSWDYHTLIDQVGACYLFPSEA